MDAELELLEDELEDHVADLEADATPSYLQPSSLPDTPQGVPGTQVPGQQVDEYGLPAMPT